MLEIRYSYIKLLQLSQEIFEHFGFSKEDSLTAAQNLLMADLRGIESHGVARLRGYLRLIEQKRINPKATPCIIRENATTAVLDADQSLGLIVAEKAMDIAIAKAQESGVGMVSVGNSSHFGIAGTYVLKALTENMIGVSMTNASALVAPTRGKTRLLGTNPIAVGVPSLSYPSFLADLATTTAANGKLEILQRKGQEAPYNWLQDAEGLPTSNANALKIGGALLPLGGDELHGSHKGFALGSIVDIFSGVFSGANFSAWVPPFPAYVPIPENPVGKGIGHFFMAMRIDNWEEEQVFLSRMDQWIESVLNTTPIDPLKPVIVPGMPEHQAYQNNLENGIALHPIVIEEINELLKELDLYDKHHLSSNLQGA
ncbi:MAG: putative oxidoreductase YjmC [candidate division WS2 bacterium]|uniref:Oxidoreductase YjmC n=1 Tax=Psychracetigena formicireducens TaxID=2986056 RepID=A0A9E2F2T2_PSYF1|nr:putative oxidoreductase YjmC [Candidatus Psychracetigena formicireducens]